MKRRNGLRIIGNLLGAAALGTAATRIFSRPLEEAPDEKCNSCRLYTTPSGIPPKRGFACSECPLFKHTRRHNLEKNS